MFHTLSHDITSLLFVDESNAGEVIDGVNLDALNEGEILKSINENCKDKRKIGKGYVYEI